MCAVMRLHVVMYRGCSRLIWGVRRALFSGVGTHGEARGFMVDEKVLATVVACKEERGLLILVGTSKLVKKFM